MDNICIDCRNSADCKRKPRTDQLTAGGGWQDMSKTWGEIREEALRKCGQLPPKTNADRIRGMSDEELAETYAGCCPNGDRLNCGKYYWRGGRDCFNCWLDWLKAPVEVDNG